MRKIVVLAIASLLSFNIAMLTNASDIIDDIIPEITTAMEKHKVPGMSVVVISNGTIKSEHYLGDAIIDTTKVNKDTTYNVGSVSKTITAWAVMALVQDGHVDLDKPISTYVTKWEIPNSDYDTSQVTVSRLLNHTSGLGQWAVPQYEPDQSIPSLEQSLSIDTNHGKEKAELIFAPGTQWRYSGAGYSMLQLLIEEVSGQSYADFVDKRIFKPLQMSNSSFVINDKILKHSAQGYVGNLKPTPLVRFAATGAAGLHTTARDLSKFVMAGLSDKNPILQKKYIDMMTTEQSDASAGSLATRKYGYGYFVIDGKPSFYGHGGDNRGWHARIIAYPKTNSGLVILTNSSKGFPVAEKANCLISNIISKVTDTVCK